MIDKLWAPWRVQYVQRAKKENGCLFCRTAKASSGKDFVFKTKHSLCMLNIYPYNNGHLMISPLKHAKDLSLLNDAELLDLFKSVNRAKTLLDRTLKPHGYNIGLNYTEIAGAGIINHLHVHIVPRWKGDTNFMPVIAGTKIISQSLKELFTILKNADKKRH